MAVKNHEQVIKELVEQNQLLVAVADIRGKRIEHLEARLEQQTSADIWPTCAQTSVQWSYGMNSNSTDSKTLAKKDDKRLFGFKIN